MSSRMMSSSMDGNLPEQDLQPKITFETWIMLPESDQELTKNDRTDATVVLKSILKPRPQMTDKKGIRSSITGKRVAFTETEIVEIENEAIRRDCESMHCHCSCGNRSTADLWYSLIILMIIFISISLVICIHHFIWVDQNGVFAVMFVLSVMGIIGFSLTLHLLRDSMGDNAIIADETEV